MDELDDALEKTRAELRAALTELSEARELRGGAAVKELAAKLQEVQADALRLESENVQLDRSLVPKRREVEKLRADLAAYRG